jgi:probable HAF family extracellular repeat protein
LRSYVSDGSSFTPIDVPGATRTIAAGINNLGQIVGNFLDADGVPHGYLTDGSSFVAIDAPGGSTLFFEHSRMFRHRAIGMTVRLGDQPSLTLS